MMARHATVILAVSTAVFLPATVALKPCDLAKGTCDGVDLSKFKGKVFKAPQDAEGYAYMLALLGELPEAALPSGCQQYAEHPSVVKYKNDNPADCIEIGSIGPCSQGECGMKGTAQPDGSLQVVYTYTYGCKSTFTITMTKGADAAPGQVTSNECAYTMSWAALSVAPSIPYWASVLIVGVAIAMSGGVAAYVRCAHESPPRITRSQLNLHAAISRGLDTEGAGAPCSNERNSAALEESVDVSGAPGLVASPAPSITQAERTPEIDIAFNIAELAESAGATLHELKEMSSDHLEVLFTEHRVKALSRHRITKVLKATTVEEIARLSREATPTLARHCRQRLSACCITCSTWPPRHTQVVAWASTCLLASGCALLWFSIIAVGTAVLLLGVITCAAHLHQLDTPKLQRKPFQTNLQTTDSNIYCDVRIPDREFTGYCSGGYIGSCVSKIKECKERWFLGQPWWRVVITGVLYVLFLAVLPCIILLSTMTETTALCVATDLHTHGVWNWYSDVHWFGFLVDGAVQPMCTPITCPAAPPISGATACPELAYGSSKSCTSTCADGFVNRNFGHIHGTFFCGPNGEWIQPEGSSGLACVKSSNCPAKPPTAHAKACKQGTFHVMKPSTCESICETNYYHPHGTQQYGNSTVANGRFKCGKEGYWVPDTNQDADSLRCVPKSCAANVVTGSSQLFRPCFPSDADPASPNYRPCKPTCVEGYKAVQSSHGFIGGDLPTIVLRILAFFPWLCFAWYKRKEISVALGNKCTRKPNESAAQLLEQHQNAQLDGSE